jgi:SAM-dependent methyltransferase
MAVFDKYETKGAYHWRECDRRSRDFNPPLLARYEMVLRHAPCGRVLDVGAGDGYLAGRLSERCREVVALEYEPSGVALARRMLASRRNVSVLEGNVYAMPCGAVDFDGLVMADVIEHLDDVQAALEECARVLRDDGVALFTTPQWRPDRVWDARHVKEFTPQELYDVLSTHFDRVELRYGWPRFWSDAYRSRIGSRLLRFAGSAFGFNPFIGESASPLRHCQMLAICMAPRR